MQLLTASLLMLTSFIISGYTQEYLVHELHWKHPIISSTLVSLSVVIPSFFWWLRERKRSPSSSSSSSDDDTKDKSALNDSISSISSSTIPSQIPVVPLRVHFVIGIILWLSFYLTSLAPLYMSYPAFLACRAAKLIPTMIIGYVWLRKRYTYTDILGGCLATIGLICIVMVEYSSHGSTAIMNHRFDPNNNNSLGTLSNNLTASTVSATTIEISHASIDIQHMDHHNTLPINDLPEQVPTTIDTLYGTVTSPLPIPLHTNHRNQDDGLSTAFLATSSSSLSSSSSSSFFTENIFVSFFQTIGYGPLILFVGLFCDGIATNAQQALFEQYHGITSQEIGFYTMGISSLLSILYGTFILPSSHRSRLLADHSSSSLSFLSWDGGALYDGIHSFLFDDYRITLFVIVYGIASYLSNIATLGILENAGAATASFTSAICKAILVLISYIVFPKPISSVQIFGIVLIFGSIVTVTIGKQYTSSATTISSTTATGLTHEKNEQNSITESDSPLSFHRSSYPDIHASPSTTLSSFTTPTPSISLSSSPLSPVPNQRSIYDQDLSVASPPTVIRSSDSLYSLLQGSRPSSEEKLSVTPTDTHTKDGIRYRGKRYSTESDTGNSNGDPNDRISPTKKSLPSSSSSVPTTETMGVSSSSSSSSKTSVTSHALHLVRTQSSRAINVVTDLLLGIERPPPSEEHLFATHLLFDAANNNKKNRLPHHLRRRTTSGTLNLRDTNSSGNTNNHHYNNRQPSGNHHVGNTPLRRALSTGDLHYSNSTMEDVPTKSSHVIPSLVPASTVSSSATPSVNINRTQSEPF